MQGTAKAKNKGTPDQTLASDRIEKAGSFGNEQPYYHRLDAPRHRASRPAGDVQKLDLLIKYESALARTWAIWASLKVSAFFTPNRRRRRLNLMLRCARIRKTRKPGQ